MSPRRDGDVRHARGLLLALVLVLSQASAWFHAVAISHVACSEHGEAIHRRTLPAADARALRATDLVALSADVATTGGHDHCANAALLRWRDVALTVPAALTEILPVRDAMPPSGAHEVARASALYRLAPKTSPPLSV
jgi:hypothetical protein